MSAADASLSKPETTQCRRSNEIRERLPRGKSDAPLPGSRAVFVVKPKRPFLGFRQAQALSGVLRRFSS
jgi:hypothetical protein